MILTIMAGLLAQQAMAGQATSLQVLTPQVSWVEVDDYPAESIRRREFGNIAFRLEVDVTGRVAACRILTTSGFWRLDQQTCAVISKRARFKPARDATGNPIPATFNSHFDWIQSGSRRDYQNLAEEVAPVIQFTISLNKLPAAYQKPTLIRVRFEGDAVAACSIEATSGSDALDRIACQQAERGVTRPPSRKDLVTRPDTRMVSVIFAVGAEAQ